ncbi:MAG: BlaB/IND/MUS family subclass B1 metallo-beta-lactamase [Bacteroidota bacterium]
MKILAIFILSCNLLFSQENVGKLDISKISENVYVYTTYNDYKGTLFPANGMYILTEKGAILIDTPWDKSQFQILLDLIEKRHSKKVITCISTHFHDDRTAGLEYYASKGIKTYTSFQTYNLCKENKEKVAENYFINDTTFNFSGTKIQTFYPGRGHTEDNIVIWLENEKILFGGCFVKSVENKSMGNIADSDLLAWPKSIKNVQNKFPEIDLVIPGHFKWSNSKALKHTLKLLKKNK